MKISIRPWLTRWRGFLLLPVVLPLCIILIPLGLLYGFVKCFIKGKFTESVHELSEKLYLLWIANDQYGNVACGDLLNDTMIKKKAKVRFGRIIQTISAVLGHNRRTRTLTGAGNALHDGLERIDPGHCEKAAKSDKYYNFLYANNS